MENKINIAEILKDCPQGMELYSPIFGKVYLDKVRRYLAIIVTTDRKQGDSKEEFLYDGRYGMNGECMLFPSKGKTTWEGFVPPCSKFKNGDVVVAEDDKSFQLFLLKHLTYSEDDNIYDGYCYFGWNFQCNELFEKGNWGFNRLATEEEKQKLFDAIKANGYKWNAETKTLEKLPKFKVGNKIKYKDTILTIIDVQTNNYIVEDEPDNFGILMFSQQDMWELVSDIKPNFKVGDRIRHKCDKNNTVITITGLKHDYYYIQYYNNIKNEYQNEKISFTDQDKYELIIDKFDINTLKPYDKVLVRDTKEQVWVADLFSHMVKRPLGGYTFACVGHYPSQCIPYEGNEHLLGTTDDCDEYFNLIS